MSKNQTFKITVPITKCYKRTTADGVEKYVIEGMASNTNLDLTGERMADTAIKSMAASLSTHPVVFKNEHGDEWDAEFGEVTALYATDGHELMMEAELDPDHYRTKALVKALEKGRQLGLSIGGYIPEGGAIKEWIADLGRLVKTYTDIILEEISVTGSPAVADTWLTNITKSVKDWKETPMSQDKELKKTQDAAEEKPAEKQPTDNAPEAGDSPEAGTESTPEDTTKSTDHDNADNPAESKSEETPSAQEAEPEQKTEAVEPEAPAQEEEPEGDATPTEKSAPEPADDNTTEVAKAAVLGSYAEADVVYDSINSLSLNLKWYVWDVVVDADKTPEEKKALVAAALSEFSSLIQTVADALIASGVSEEMAKSAEVERAQTPEALSKSLTESTTKAEDLQKSLDAKTQEAESIQKSLDETKSELEETKKSLAEKETELEKRNGRKAIVFGKFGGSEVTGDTSLDDEYAEKGKEFNRDFAKKFIGTY